MEDNPADVRLVREALEEYGVQGELIVIVDGESAISYFEAIVTDFKECPDLAIIDLNLPKRPGRDVLAAMRARVHFATTPVVVFSSSDAALDRTEAERLGVSRYLRKPTSLDEFMRLGMVFRELATTGKRSKG